LSAAVDRHRFDPEVMDRLQKESIKRAQGAVKFTEKIISEARLPESGTVAVSFDIPKQLILKEAEDWGANLIVVGSHGLRGLTRLLLGSVSETVAAHAPCSVEVIRHSPK
jgi:nucleotide-binding universal stress UspA family protein